MTTKNCCMTKDYLTGIKIILTKNVYHKRRRGLSKIMDTINKRDIQLSTKKIYIYIYILNDDLMSHVYQSCWQHMDNIYETIKINYKTYASFNIQGVLYLKLHQIYKQYCHNFLTHWYYMGKWQDIIPNRTFTKLVT